MDEAQILKRELELREQCPEMFSHPECLPGEVWLGDQVVDVVHMNAGIYRNAGLTSARVGNARMGKITGQLSGVAGKPVEREFDCRFHGIFANLHELIIEEEKHKQAQGE
jgi:hypothetical protein